MDQQAHRRRVIERLKSRLDDSPRLESKEDFMMLAACAGLYVGLTGELHTVVREFVERRDDIDDLFVELLSYTIELDDPIQALMIIVLQKLVILAHSVNMVRPLGVEVWEKMMEAEAYASSKPLTEYAADEVKHWRDAVELPEELWIAAVDTPLCASERQLIEFLKKIGRIP